MSDRYRQERRDSRESSRYSSRRSPPRHHRSRRSPSPGPSRSRGSPQAPRDPRNLPESFGRVQDAGRQDDDLNILERMRTAFATSPLAKLYAYIKGNSKVKIWTRNYKEVRGVMTGYIMAFDKHWNIVLRDVDEVYLKQKKNKTPFLREVAANENLPDIPIKVPKEKKTEAEKAAAAEAQSKPSERETEPSKKKVKRKKSKTTSEKRQIDQIFIRGDNVVMICPIDDIVSVEDDDEEEGATRESV